MSPAALIETHTGMSAPERVLHGGGGGVGGGGALSRWAGVCWTQARWAKLGERGCVEQQYRAHVRTEPAASIRYTMNGYHNGERCTDGPGLITFKFKMRSC